MFSVNPYPAGTKTDLYLPSVKSQTTVCTSMQSDQALYCWLTNIKFSPAKFLKGNHPPSIFETVLIIFRDIKMRKGSWSANSVELVRLHR